MIVCSLPRCGATKYCLDLQEQTGLKFVGELNPMYIYDNRKQVHHETGVQQTFTPRTFANVIHDKKHYIILVNKQAYLNIDICDTVILRKNMIDAFLSFANFLIKMYPDIDTKVLINEVIFSIYDYRAIEAYINRYNKHVVWYEEYYGKSGTITPLLDTHKHSRFIKESIINAFEAC